MKNNALQPGDEDLSRVLREARPAPDLPPGFQNSVWHRIEAVELANESGDDFSWLDRVVGLLLRPRLAIASLALLVVLGGSLGVMNGVSLSKQAERDRYIASVSPMTVRE